MKRVSVAWGSFAPRKGGVAVTEVRYFRARGMKLVFGRGDYYDRHHSFHMDIWKTRDSRLLMRCWSRCSEIDSRSFAITGVDVARLPMRDAFGGFGDEWVPQVVRSAYEEWIRDEY